MTIFNESNERIAALPGLNTDYGAKEARQALAFQDIGAGAGGTNLAKFTPIVGVSSSSILAAGPERTSVIIQNLSANDVYIEFGLPANTTDSLKILPDEKLTVPSSLMVTEEIFAIASGAGSQLVIYTTGV